MARQRNTGFSSRSGKGVGLWHIIAIVVMLLAMGIFAFLGTYSIPVPSGTEEKIMPNDRIAH